MVAARHNSGFHPLPQFQAKVSKAYQVGSRQQTGTTGHKQLEYVQILPVWSCCVDRAWLALFSPTTKQHGNIHHHRHHRFRTLLTRMQHTQCSPSVSSASVILYVWMSKFRARNYYKSKEECCKEQSTPGPDCDCKWNGYTYDNLPPPSAYSRMFTDECDGKPSINRVRRTRR